VWRRLRSWYWKLEMEEGKGGNVRFQRVHPGDEPRFGPVPRQLPPGFKNLELHPRRQPVAQQPRPVGVTTGPTNGAVVLQSVAEKTKDQRVSAASSQMETTQLEQPQSSLTDPPRSPAPADSSLSVPDEQSEESSAVIVETAKKPSKKDKKKKAAELELKAGDRHPECTLCPPKKQKKGPAELTEWNAFLKKFRLEHPGMVSGEVTMEARKRYVPSSGKKKSYERLWKEVWRYRNPQWKDMYTPEEAKEQMRKDFIERI